MTPQIVPATAEHAAAASALVRESFDRFVAPDWEAQACAVLYTEASVERLTLAIPAATYAALAQVGDGFAAFILLSRPSLLGMLFVRPSHVRQGLGALLWEAARAHVEAQYPDTKTVELNASPYAVPAYRAMGFYPISEPFRRGGALATRMACWLPGRALQRTPGATGSPAA